MRHRFFGSGNDETDDAGRRCGPRFAGLFGHAGPFARARGARMFDAGALRLVTLGFIAEQPRHGYDIIKGLSASFQGAYRPSPGSIYPILRMLEDAGLVSSQSQQSALTTSQLTTEQALQTSLNAKVTSVSGVNMDTELSQMLTLQNAYGANARVISAVQSMFTSLLQAVQ